jgi:hypothetical protein
MATWLTLSERKQARLASLCQAVAELRVVLSAYGQAHGGRFLLYGSAARGELRHDSDVDLLVDFADVDDACRFAEEACWDRGLSPDLRPLAWCTPGFLERIRPDMESLP